MHKLLYLFCGLFVLFFSGNAFAQPCTSGQSTAIIVVETDGYGYECSWTLASSGGTQYGAGGQGGTYASNMQYRDTICIPSNSCTNFTITDSYGDGICCTYGNGYFLVIVDGDTIATGGNYTASQTVDFNCPPGSSCSSPDTVIAGGPYATTYDDHWYSFTPDSNGMYEISTCTGNSCNTKIWVYELCGPVIDETNVGTIFYDDNSCGSGSQLAIVNAALAAGSRYIIRIGDYNDNCPGAVSWSITYNGPIVGCTDPTACNYNPLATVSDTCIYPGNPLCPSGPDLLLREDVLRSSMYVATYNATDACMVAENCINGLGNRQLIRFTTHIENNGTQDYYVGSPSANPTQFNTTNCHGHPHYEGYAEYVLYDVNQSATPIGFKSGFCVMDLVCDHGGSAQYGCSVMGITAGCGDIYDASLDCQWIDITTVADGDYTFVARVNWDFSPDALGRYETSYSNNWGQVCFNLSRASGAPQITINTANCPTFTDCLGVPFGSAVPDCNGNCAGSAVMGDLNTDTLSNTTDLGLYTAGILNNTLSTTNCNDLHQDTIMNVFDAALLVRCMNDPTKCNFPNGIVNIFDTAYLSIGAVNFTDNYVDIHMRNPDNKVLAYEFTMAGIAIDSVVSLVQYPTAAQWSAATSKVLALSVNDSSINRTALAQPICRIYFNSVTGNQICINSIEGIVSDIYQALIPRIEGPCFAPSNTQALANNFEVAITPNPLKESTRFNFSQDSQNPMTLEILDATGKQVRVFTNITGRNFEFQREGLPAGLYFYRINSEMGIRSGKMIME